MRDPARNSRRLVWLGREGDDALAEERARSLWQPVVSAVVPLFKSEAYVERCLRSLLRYLPRDSEVIVVDDASPDASGEIARRVLTDDGRGLLLTLAGNHGFPRAVNAGARYASGRYLLMMNADAFAPAGFADPMICALDRDEQTAVVGNRHVRPDGRVDSEGSEFCWRGRNYEHVTRNITDPVPAAPGEDEGRSEKRRDVVTFACAMVRRSVWEELGGLDESYVRAYFEDADFCLRARAAGYRVVYTPRSTIIHVGHHSHAAQAEGRRPYEANKALFTKRWVDTGLVDRFRRERGIAAHYGRVVVCMIACGEEEFVASAIESVYPLADRIVIVEGGNRFAVEAGLCDARGRSLDGTVEEVQAFKDYQGKIELHVAPGRPWRDKHEMRDKYVERIEPGDWMLLLDADEVFSERGLWRLSALMHEADVIRPGFDLFWNDMGTCGTGKWHKYRQVKCVRWRQGLTYRRDHNMPCDERGTPVTALGDVRVVEAPERLYCHYSWAGKTVEKLATKARYYVGQNGADVFPPDYMERVFLPWREGDEKARREIEKRHGTHPYGGGGTARFAGEHPGPVARRMDEGKIHDGDTEARTAR